LFILYLGQNNIFIVMNGFKYTSTVGGLLRGVSYGFTMGR
jgi:hypothetical protein